MVALKCKYWQGETKEMPDREGSRKTEKEGNKPQVQSSKYLEKEEEVKCARAIGII